MVPVIEHVRHELAARRAAGAPFDIAWPLALRAVPAPDVDGWLDVLDATRDAWASAYDHAPLAGPQRALLAVAVDPFGDRQALEQPSARERICRTCDGPIPATRDRRARYCSHRCQRAAHGRGVAAARR